jgi:hypothetical protein
MPRYPSSCARKSVCGSMPASWWVARALRTLLAALLTVAARASGGMRRSRGVAAQQAGHGPWRARRLLPSGVGVYLSSALLSLREVEAKPGSKSSLPVPITPCHASNQGDVLGLFALCHRFWVQLCGAKGKPVRAPCAVAPGCSALSSHALVEEVAALMV